MNLKGFYKKIREVEATILEDFPIIVSLPTADGGKEGTQTEVTRNLAAKMVVQGLARLARDGEAAAFRELQNEAKKLAEQAAAAAKVQLAVLTTKELSRLANAAATKE